MMPHFKLFFVLSKPELSSNRSGFGVIEIIVAAAIIGIVIFSVTQVGILAFRLAQLSAERTEAVFLMQEAGEAVRFFRDDSWTARVAALSAGTPYFLTFDGVNYTLTSVEPPLIGGKFRRVITMSDVNRNAQSDISDTGTDDPLTKKFSVAVSWYNRNIATIEEIEFYLTDLFNN